jgi:phosphopantetheinyl transferase (holo-ACP synthase)
MLPDTRFLKSALGDPLGFDLALNVARGNVSESILSDKERIRHQSTESTVRAKSWLLGRAALKRLRTEVDGREDIEDIEFPNARYSLTHSADLAIAVADVSGSLKGIGVDLEVNTRIGPAAARFFLTEREQSWLEEQAAAYRPHLLLRLWCIKEALFKANPENAGRMLADHETAEPGNASGDACSCSGRIMHYASWCESRTCIALAVCK